jgi:integrase
MASIRQRDGRFHVQIRMSGFPSRTETFATRRLAERWAKTIEAEMIEGRHFRHVEARRRTLAEAIDRYLLEEVSKKRDGRQHRQTLPFWRAALGHLRLADVTAAVIVEHRNKLARGTYRRAKPESSRSIVKNGKPREFARSASTVNKYCVTLRHLFTVACKEWHWASHNPFDGVKKLKERGGRVRYLSDAERTRLLVETARNPTLHCLVVLALSTAARAGELTHLGWRETDLKEGRLLFRVTKNAEPRVVWVHGEGLRLLRERSKVRSLTNHDVFPGTGARRRYWDYSKPFAAACKAADIESFRFHDLRHSAATYLAMQGASEQQLRAIGGWKSGIVSRYVHLAATDARSALQKLADKIDGKDATNASDARK